MATKTVVTLVDDLTGEDGENVTTVEFALDGATYEIDLDENNATELRDALADYVRNGRRVSARPGRGRAQSRRAAPAPAPRRAASSNGPRSREESQAIREWAAKQGISVANRGRIPDNVAERYSLAHQS